MHRSARRATLVALIAICLTLPVSAGLVRTAFAAVPPRDLAHAGSTVNRFVPTGSMSVARSGATATLLENGEVLEAGGGTASAELYDPSTGRWSDTGSMSAARTDATATLLTDGDVLVAGGCCEIDHPYRGLTSAELYDPSTGKWSATGSLNVGRSGATATLLQDGDVLVAGGACNGSGNGCDAGSSLVNLKTAELYNSSSGKWSFTGSMSAGTSFRQPLSWPTVSCSLLVGSTIATTTSVPI